MDFFDIVPGNVIFLPDKKIPAMVLSKVMESDETGSIFSFIINTNRGIFTPEELGIEPFKTVGDEESSAGNIRKRSNCLSVVENQRPDSQRNRISH